MTTVPAAPENTTIEAGLDRTLEDGPPPSSSGAAVSTPQTLEDPTRAWEATRPSAAPDVDLVRPMDPVEHTVVMPNAPGRATAAYASPTTTLVPPAYENEDITRVMPRPTPSAPPVAYVAPVRHASAPPPAARTASAPRPPSAPPAWTASTPPHAHAPRSTSPRAALAASFVSDLLGVLLFLVPLAFATATIAALALL